ncbi:UDP-N-acetylmuramate--L-alanine ligase [Anaerosinus massiliensis]|uniref:UDP-N-acetylmuramate--L-alanine ligase n=1 Tax=Massilibacillus massiliensis TaxID=1806837 RepID=UPI000B1A3A09|nr:UDP-N-acetylmuramate--L-alanine ligase [Massilibacillus massiliensis]
MLNGINKIHFVGIGGAGMSAIAKILVEKGFEVSGSDLQDSEIVSKLKALGATIFYGQRKENVKNADAIVVSTAISEQNPEVVAAKEKHIKIFHRSDIVAALMNQQMGIAIAGAHGKTTTTSMIGVMLDYAGSDPSIIIGGEVDYLGSNAKLGHGEYLVAEADESDGSFLKLLPKIAVVTNIENDHMDFYGTMENILKTFEKFLNNLPQKDGLAVLCFNNVHIRNIAKKLDRKFISYAIDEDADYVAKNITTNGAGTSFEVYRHGENLGRISLNIPGKHNVLNALASIIVGDQLGLSITSMAAGLRQFNGAKRRFQTKGRVKDVWVVDDYAHHPTELSTTLSAARQTKPKRLICVFQPHRYSRTQLLRKEFGVCFDEADMLVLTDVYSAGEKPIEGVSGETIRTEVEKHMHKDIVYIADRKEIASYLSDFVTAGDLVMTMGAGNIYLTGEELVAKLNEK